MSQFLQLSEALIRILLSTTNDAREFDVDFAEVSLLVRPLSLFAFFAFFAHSSPPARKSAHRRDLAMYPAHADRCAKRLWDS